MLHLLINKGIEINSDDFLYKNNEKNLNEENEEDIDKDKEPNEQSIKNDYIVDKNKNTLIISLEKNSRNNRIIIEKCFKKVNKK